MKDERLQARIQQALNAELSGLRTSPVQREELYRNAAGGYDMKRKWKVGWVLALALILFTVTAVAALMTHREIIELFAVPMALENDEAGVTQESYSHEELVALIQTLNENGVTLEADGSIMCALENGTGYWEEEVLMAICREAFGGLFYEWSVEEKYWFETQTVQIGFKERNPYLVPEAGDMTVPEARALAAQLLRERCGAGLPVESNDDWKLCEWFYAPWTDMAGFHAAMWKFEYINRRTGTTEYTVRFDREGGNVQIEEADFHAGPEGIATFAQAESYMSDKYGAMPYWPVSAWAEFGDVIAPMKAETTWQWCYQHAGYCEIPDGALPVQEAIRIAQEAVGASAWEGSCETSVICCNPGARAIYKVMLSLREPGHEEQATADAIWLTELDCLTGEVTAVRAYDYGLPSLPMYVPFDVVAAAPAFNQTLTAEEQARIAEKQRQADAYHRYEAEYGEMWYFWPLEAQQDALGAPRHVPEAGEMSRETAEALALEAIRQQRGEAALSVLGEYRVGALCKRRQTGVGEVTDWQFYITSDPVTLSNGYRVSFTLLPGEMEPAEPILVEAANAENG